MNEKQQVLRGKEAAMVLENAVIQEIWTGIENEAVEALIACSMKPDAKEDRDALIWHLKLVKKQKGIVLGMIEQGKFAQHQIDRKAEESKTRTLLRRVTG